MVVRHDAGGPALAFSKSKPYAKRNHHHTLPAQVLAAFLLSHLVLDAEPSPSLLAFSGSLALSPASHHPWLNSGFPCPCLEQAPSLGLESGI